jgi:hypothetical protein
MAQFDNAEGAGDLARRQERAAGPPLWHQAGVDHLADRPAATALPSPRPRKVGSTSTDRWPRWPCQTW